MRPGALQVAGELAHDVTALGEGAAAGNADEVLGVVVGEEAARAVADGVEAFDDGALGGQDLALLVDGEAVARGEQGAAEPGAVEGRGANLGQAIGLLAEVLVVLDVEEAVVTVDLGQEGGLRVALKAQLVGELVEGVTLEEQAVLDLLGIGLGGVGGLGKRGLRHLGAAVGGKALDILGHVGVENHCPHAVGMLLGGEAGEVVGAGLVPSGASNYSTSSATAMLAAPSQMPTGMGLSKG